MNQYTKKILFFILMMGGFFPQLTFAEVYSLEMITTDTSNAEISGSVSNVSISTDMRYMAFISSDTNLVVGDTNGVNDVFVKDRTLNTIERVSIATGGAEADASSSRVSISEDGRYVAFTSGATNLVVGDTNGWADIFVHDRNLDTTERVSISTANAEGDFNSGAPIISSTGRYVVFSSGAENLVAGDTNLANDIFIRDTL